MVGGSSGVPVGSSVASAGDANGDGYADVIVGAGDVGTGSGSAFVSAGGPTGLSTTSFLWSAFGEGGLDSFGSSVASAGDVNGDGFADLLVGAKSYGVSNDGRAYVYHGSTGGGQLVLSRPMRQDSKQIQPWGLADSSSMFVLRMGATYPAGRGRIKLEAEACPPGVAFGAAGCVTVLGPTWHDTVPAGGLPLPRELGVTIWGLQGGTLYRWRARVLYAPYSVNQAGVTSPPNPAHGPWRRFQAQAFEADVRTLGGERVFLPLVVRNH